MYEIMQPRNNARVRITRVGSNVKIKTPYQPRTREFLRHYVAGLAWDDFLGAWTGVVPTEEQERLGRILKSRFMSPVLLEDEQPTPTSPTQSIEAPADAHWSVVL